MPASDPVPHVPPFPNLEGLLEKARSETVLHDSPEDSHGPHAAHEEPTAVLLQAAPSEVDWAHERGELRGRGVGMVLGGAGLIVFAILAACMIPDYFVNLFREREGGSAASIAWAANVAGGAAWIWGAASVGFASAGLGSMVLRRWSLPIIHAGAWLAVISVLMMLAVASAFYFFISPPNASAESKAMLGTIGNWLLVIGGFGVVVPLFYIACYQRSHLSAVCVIADPKPRWTDPVGEPLLMLWLACLAVAAGLGALLFFDGAFPLFGRIVTEEAGRALTIASLAGALAAAWLTGRRNAAGWRLALALFAFLAATGISTFLQRPWGEFLQALGRPGPATEMQNPGKIAAMLIGAAFAPLAMVLLMSRSAFRHAESHAPSHH